MSEEALEGYWRGQAKEVVSGGWIDEKSAVSSHPRDGQVSKRNRRELDAQMLTEQLGPLPPIMRGVVMAAFGIGLSFSVYFQEHTGTTNEGTTRIVFQGLRDLGTDLPTDPSDLKLLEESSNIGLSQEGGWVIDTEGARHDWNNNDLVLSVTVNPATQQGVVTVFRQLPFSSLLDRLTNGAVYEINKENDQQAQPDEIIGQQIPFNL